MAVAAALSEPSAAIGARRLLRIEPRSNWELTIRIRAYGLSLFVVSTASASHHAPSLARVIPVIAVEFFVSTLLSDARAHYTLPTRAPNTRQGL